MKQEKFVPHSSVLTQKELAAPIKDHMRQAGIVINPQFAELFQKRNDELIPLGVIVEGISSHDLKYPNAALPPDEETALKEDFEIHLTPAISPN